MARHTHDSPRLCEHLDGLVTDLNRLVPQAVRAGQVDAVHDARVATRRVQSATRLFRPLLPNRRRRRFVRGLRKLRRKLRRLRDLDVMIDHLQHDPIATSPAHAPASTWLLERLQHRRQTEHECLSRRRSRARRLADPLDHWNKLRHRIPTRPDVVEWHLAQAVREHAQRFVHDADALASGTAASSADLNPHLLRIDGKRLRYTLEILRAHRHTIPAGTLRLFKQMQEILGLWHDYVVLSSTAIQMALDESLAYHDPERHRQVLALAQAMRDQADTHWQAFRNLWAHEGAHLAQSLDELCSPSGAAADNGAARVTHHAGTHGNGHPDGRLTTGGP